MFCYTWNHVYTINARFQTTSMRVETHLKCRTMTGWRGMKLTNVQK